MALYRFSDDEVKQLRAILMNANIKGSDAPLVIVLMRNLQIPIPEQKKSEKLPVPVKKDK